MDTGDGTGELVGHIEDGRVAVYGTCAAVLAESSGVVDPGARRSSYG